LEGKTLTVDATCDQLAKFLNGLMPCDKGHDFSKVDSTELSSDTLA